MGAVSGLLLDRGIPPQVIEDDGVRSGQVQSGTAGLQRNEEQVAFPVVEAGAKLYPFDGRRLPVEIKEGEAAIAQLTSD
ncbi:hypothetical protein D3C76_1714540 [compost metagenome]